MKELTLAQHRTRIENLNSAEEDNRQYFRRHRVHDYLPGQATYNLGDYPARFSIMPTEYDFNMLQDMAGNGVQLIQIHEEWNDPVRHLGADKYSTFDTKGLQKFVDLCHYFNIKIIPYISSGFFHEYDPDFRKEFVIRQRYCITGMHFKYATCSASSAEWRNYVLPRTFAVLDKYEFDGIYNDCGTDSHCIMNGKLRTTPDGLEFDPELEDLLSLIYSEVKRRHGVYKLHFGWNHGAETLDRVYDYLWIGECVSSSEPGVGKDYPYYVVPCPDHVHHVEGDAEYHFAKLLPFVQFPLLTRGRPLMGKRIGENIPYYGNENGPGVEYAFNQRVAEYMEAHPNGPYVYSLWSSIPDDPQDYPLWCKYLALYKPMVEENSLVYVELRDCAEILSPLPEKIFATMYVNEEKYLVVSNFTDSDYTLVLRDTWTDRIAGILGKSFEIKRNEMLLLKKDLARST
jgi:hypothetical protein